MSATVNIHNIDWKENRTAEQWAELAEALHEAARESNKRSAESFERSDTDGFLSQWASDMTARKYNAQADLADNHGFVYTTALFTVNGELASTHNGWGQYGEYWVLNDVEANRFGKRFFNPSKAKNELTRYHNDRKKGYVLGTIKVRGYVKNLSGPNAITLHYGAVPSVDDLKSRNFEVITRDDNPEGRG